MGEKLFNNVVVNIVVVIIDFSINLVFYLINFVMFGGWDVGEVFNFEIDNMFEFIISFSIFGFSIVWISGGSVLFYLCYISIVGMVD